jgi:hypothetical protein
METLSELKTFVEKHISPEKKDEISKLLFDVKSEIKDENSMNICLELQKEIHMLSIVCTNMKKELDELKEQCKDLRDSFLMKVMMEKVAYVPLEKLPIYKNKMKE